MIRHGTDPRMEDTDGDGITDGDEVNGDPQTNPLQKEPTLSPTTVSQSMIYYDLLFHLQMCHS